MANGQPLTLVHVSLDAKNLLHNRKKKFAKQWANCRFELIQFVDYFTRNGTVELARTCCMSLHMVSFLCSTQMNYQHLFQIECFINTPLYHEISFEKEILQISFMTSIDSQWKYPTIDIKLTSLLWPLNRFHQHSSIY